MQPRLLLRFAMGSPGAWRLSSTVHPCVTWGTKTGVTTFFFLEVQSHGSHNARRLHERVSSGKGGDYDHRIS